MYFTYLLTYRKWTSDQLKYTHKYLTILDSKAMDAQQMRDQTHKQHDLCSF